MNKVFVQNTEGSVYYILFIVTFDLRGTLVAFINTKKTCKDEKKHLNIESVYFIE